MRKDLHCLSGSTLKMIALASMTIDHVAYYVMGKIMGFQGSWQYDCLREVGRLAFPIFAFLVVEGYRHTHNLQRYMSLLFESPSLLPIDKSLCSFIFLTISQLAPLMGTVEFSY